VSVVTRHGPAPEGDGGGDGAPSPPSTRDPRWFLAAALLAVIVVALVLILGVVRPPPLAALDEPSFDGAVAYVAWDREPCLHVLAADGARSEVRCDPQLGELLAWPETGIVLRSWRGDRPQLETVDPQTGTVVDRVDAAEPEGDGWWPVSDLGPAGPDRDGRLEVRYRGTAVWSVEAHGDYEVTAGWGSPDGRWVALQDSADRLLLVPADGSAAPAVWAEDVEGYSPLVWRGDSLPR
jgi:hypothetical protein